MDTETAANPADDTALATVTEPGAEPEGQIEDQQFDDDGNPIEAPPEDEEIELDEDLKLKVPKDQAQKVREALLRQADYSRKTMALADDRKAFEAERQSLNETSQAELNAFATAQSIGQQIQAYAQVNWQGLMAQAVANFDTEEQARIQGEFMRYQQLKDAQSAALSQLQHLRGQRISAVQQETAKRIEEGRQVLTREIGWTPDLKARLLGFAAEFGYTREELENELEADPRAAKILHAAFEGREASRKAKAANSHLQAQQAQPAAKVGARSAPPTGLDDRLSIDEWNRRREAQLRKKAGR